METLVNISEGCSADLAEDYDAAGDVETETAQSSEPADHEIIKESLAHDYDPFKTYLKSISPIPLLTREEEVAVARQIEICKLKIFSIIFTIPFVLNKFAELGRLVKKGEVRLSEYVQDLEGSKKKLRRKKNCFGGPQKRYMRSSEKGRTKITDLPQTCFSTANTTSLKKSASLISNTVQ